MKKISITNKLVISLFLFFVISLITIYSAKNISSNNIDNIIFKQLLYYGIGIIILLFSFYKKNTIIKYHMHIYIFINILLFLLLLLGIKINGSKCWIIIGPISFQPSEFMKISLLIMQVYLIEKFKKKCPSPTIFQEFKLLVLVFIIFIIPSLITFLEPDTGAVIIYFIITITILFISKIRLQWFVIMFIVVSLFLAIFFGIYFYKQNLFIKILGSDFF